MHCVIVTIPRESQSKQSSRELERTNPRIHPNFGAHGRSEAFSQCGTAERRSTGLGTQASEVGESLASRWELTTSFNEKLQGG